MSELDEQITLCRNELQLYPKGHPDRVNTLDDLALSLYDRFHQRGEMIDLDEALALQRSALELRPQGHPDRAFSSGNFAHCLLARSGHSAMRDISGLQETFSLYSQPSDPSQTVSSADLECAKQWIQAAEVPSLPQPLALLKQLTTSLPVDALSTCVRYGNSASAIKLLEQGHGVFWSQLIRLRSPLDEVMSSDDTGKGLADEFTQLTSLHSVLDAPPNVESQHDRACHLNIQLQDIVADIRKLPGLSRFRPRSFQTSRPQLPVDRSSW